MQPGDKAFPKQQSLHYMVGYKQERGKDPILCADEPASACETIKVARPELNATAGMTSTLPQWIENDRKVHTSAAGTLVAHLTGCSNWLRGLFFGTTTCSQPVHSAEYLG